MPQAEKEYHRRTAVSCFNRAWECLVMKNRTQEDDRQMLLLAHASRYHWGLVGTSRNRAVGEWQISRVYAALGQPQLALQFAKTSLATCKKDGLGEIIHTAYEAVARAYAVAKDYENARKYLERARRHLDSLALEKEDKRVFSDQICETEALIPT